MSNSPDLSFRPRSYFWAKKRGISLLSDIKGANRRRLCEQSLQDEAIGQVPPILTAQTLSDEERRFIGRLHPGFMGGEYLPNTRGNEVEIARITIASTTQDVTCVYARSVRNRLSYRIVDEYNGDTLSGPDHCTSLQPLTMGELLDFFLNGWDLLGCLDYNFSEYGYPRDEIHNFIVDASSSFYAEFEQAIYNRIDKWLDEIYEDLELDSDEDEEDD
jgi:hypothetical protein